MDLNSTIEEMKSRDYIFVSYLHDIDGNDDDTDRENDEESIIEPMED